MKRALFFLALLPGIIHAAPVKYVQIGTTTVSTLQPGTTAGFYVSSGTTLNFNASTITTNALTVISSFTAKTKLDMSNNQIINLGTATAGGQAVRFEQLKLIQIASGTVSASSATTGTTYGNTGLAATITPTSAQNLIFIVASGMLSNSAGELSNSVLASLARGATNLAAGGGSMCNIIGQVITVRIDEPCTMTFLDSPATTSATTYNVIFRSVSATDTTTWGIGNQTSSITVFEIAPN